MAIIKNIKKKFLIPVKKFVQRNHKDLKAKKSLALELLKKSDRVHLGCGDIIKKGFINVDYRTTLASDISYDCSDLSIFPSNSLKAIFSNAFFEHLYKDDRIPSLKSIYTALKPDGEVIFIGIPDFEKIARAYIDKRKGLLSETFDLYHVYRFTHGDPEHVSGWWLEQLHKSLFDKNEMEHLLEGAGFRHYIIFDYAYKNDELVLSMGFIAFKNKPQIKLNKEWLIRHIAEYSADVRGNSIEILSVKN